MVGGMLGSRMDAFILSCYLEKFTKMVFMPLIDGFQSLIQHMIITLLLTSIIYPIFKLLMIKVKFVDCRQHSLNLHY